MARIPKFQPHNYATHLTHADQWRSNRGLLYQWLGTHWVAVEDTEATSAAYHWLVKHQPEHVSPENAVRAVRAALMFLPPLPDTATLAEVVVLPRGYTLIHHEDVPIVYLSTFHRVSLDWEKEGADWVSDKVFVDVQTRLFVVGGRRRKAGRDFDRING